ncbi:hypothetical protein EML15_01385 [Corynebacterium sp. sy017]|uniref:YciI family protein n=1 Tax=unclassified Corynebacterium TaxID=2624378 RepID=UPI001186F40F|nr:MULTISPECIES: YciI family protein [unclassified Corynebacterium]MBP3087807.1 hypothetical protein [Corynebacterium sp. sy017]TSD92352.1 hypothetical protein ELY17_01385 [Corynebacterium sp. SY003]
MKTFLITYMYDTESSTIDQLRPPHRAFLAQLKEEGKLVGSGRLVEGTGAGNAIIILQLSENSTIADVEKLLEDDPFCNHNAIDGRTIQVWDPTLKIWD